MADDQSINSENLDVIVERISNLRDDIREVKDLVKEVGVQQQVAKEDRIKICNRVEYAHLRIDQIQKHFEDQQIEMRQLKKQVQPLIFTNKIVAAIGSIALISILGLVWALLTGQVQLVFL